MQVGASGSKNAQMNPLFLKEQFGLSFFFCTPAPGTAFDLLMIEAAATAADGIMERFECLRPLRSSKCSGSHCIPCSPKPDCHYFHFLYLH